MAGSSFKFIPRSPGSLALVLPILLLSASAPASGAEIKLSWDPTPTPDIDGYMVYYDTDSESPPYEGSGANEGDSPIDMPLEVLDPLLPEMTLTGLSSCLHYWFAVTAYIGDDESVYSNWVEGTAIAKPSTLVASTLRPGAITLSWDGPPADDDGTIDHYLVHTFVESDDDEGFAEIADSPMTVSGQTTAEVVGLTPGVTYSFTVESVCPDGATNESVTVDATPFEDPVGEDVAQLDAGRPDSSSGDDVSPPDAETFDATSSPDVSTPEPDAAPADVPDAPIDPDAAVINPGLDSGTSGTDAVIMHPAPNAATGSADEACGCSLRAPQKRAAHWLGVLVLGILVIARRR